MNNLKNGDLLHTLDELDAELNNAIVGFKCGFWLGFTAGAAMAGVITWFVMA